MKEYIVKIQLPYITKQREVLKLSSDRRALVIYDKFKGQCTPAICDSTCEKGPIP